ncbi:MAG: phenylalanine--tRNA ligase subunit beta, partial [Oceanospirillaceae bacterium]|nr:phenylalanine--tRNA ligase subunit beta [Oceanospirillaceae bacterium]
DVFFEAAFFNPISIAGRARSYGMHTDSSHRFERGVDWQLQVKAMERATELLLDICGGEAGPVTEVASEDNLPKVEKVRLRHAKVNSYLSFDMPVAEIEEILTRLGMAVAKDGDDAWLIDVPSYRFDISIEVDLIEELARVYGYNNLPVRVPKASLPFKADVEANIGLGHIRRTLIAQGYQEAITYSFIEAGLQEKFDDQNKAVALANPITAEMAVMRTTVWPGLVKAVQYNQNRQQSRIRLFETGQRFLPRGENMADMLQENVVAGVVTGSRDPEGWTATNESVDFFDVKSEVESLLALAGSAEEFTFVSGRHVALHPGQTAVIKRNGEEIGYLGAMHPSLAKDLGLSGAVYLFELKLEVITAGRLPRYSELSKFPESRRDLALIVDEQVAFEDLRQSATENAGEFLQNVTLFDVYQGQGIEVGRKSLALGLTWQHPSRTLNDDEINGAVDSVITALKTKFGASLRE